nr:MAG TPA: hypothetical protein [Caudoviricetes sp.]
MIIINFIIMTFLSALTGGWKGENPKPIDILCKIGYL